MTLQPIWITEDAALEPLSLNGAMVDAEDSAARFTAAGGNGVVLRFGQFVQPESPMTQALLDGAAKGRVPLVGRPDAYQSMVDVGDAAAGVVAALDAPAGTYNVCEERPATRAEHLAALEAVVGHRVRMLPRAAAMVPVMAFISRCCWPTPTGTLCPALPHMPMPVSRAESLPTIEIRCMASGPLPISIAPVTGAPILPSSIM